MEYDDFEEILGFKFELEDHKSNEEIGKIDAPRLANTRN